MREELRKARLSRGLRQEDVAKKLGMSTRMYQHLEAGSRDGKVKHWDALEDLFGIPHRYDRDFAGRASATTFPAREARQLRAEELERKLSYVWKSHAEDADGYRSFRFRELVSVFGGEFADESGRKVFEDDEVVFGATEDSL